MLSISQLLVFYIYAAAVKQGEVCERSYEMEYFTTADIRGLFHTCETAAQYVN